MSVTDLLDNVQIDDTNEALNDDINNDNNVANAIESNIFNDIENPNNIPSDGKILEQAWVDVNGTANDIKTTNNDDDILATTDVAYDEIETNDDAVPAPAPAPVPDNSNDDNIGNRVDRQASIPAPVPNDAVVIAPETVIPKDDNIETVKPPRIMSDEEKKQKIEIDKTIDAIKQEHKQRMEEFKKKEDEAALMDAITNDKTYKLKVKDNTNISSNTTDAPVLLSQVNKPNGHNVGYSMDINGGYNDGNTLIREQISMHQTDISNIYGNIDPYEFELNEDYKIRGSFKTNWEQYVKQPTIKGKVFNLKGKEEELFFADPKAPRRVYIGIKIKRISDVDNVKETYRCRFHIYFNWLITRQDFNSYVTYKKKTKNVGKVEWFPPSFKPRFEFLNIVEAHLFEEYDYGVEGPYRVQKMKDFDKNLIGFDPEYAYFVRLKLEVDGTFSEELGTFILIETEYIAAFLYFVL